MEKILMQIIQMNMCICKKLNRRKTATQKKNNKREYVECVKRIVLYNI